MTTSCTWNAEDYQRHSDQQQYWARKLIAKLRLRGDEHVLDIGCGDGKVTAEIAVHVPRGRVVGLDSSPQMVALAHRSFPPAKHPNLSFVLGDATALAFVVQFDVVFSNACLHWVRDQRAVLRGIAGALKPGGRVLLQMGGRGNAAALMETVNDLMTRESWKSFFTGFEFPYAFCGPEEYGDWMCAAGLQPRRVELLPKDMIHAGAEGLAGWVRSTWLPYTQRVPAELRERFVEDLVSRYLACHPLDGAGKTHVDMVRLEVEGSRPGRQ